MYTQVRWNRIRLYSLIVEYCTKRMVATGPISIRLLRYTQFLLTHLHSIIGVFKTVLKQTTITYSDTET